MEIPSRHEEWRSSRCAAADRSQFQPAVNKPRIERIKRTEFVQFVAYPIVEMYFHQFYLGCLAHASYLIGSQGEAAVVDPQRDIDIYLEDAKAHNLTIKHVIETHCHADFVSGHHELAARTG